MRLTINRYILECWTSAIIGIFMSTLNSHWILLRFCCFVRVFFFILNERCSDFAIWMWTDEKIYNEITFYFSISNTFWHVVSYQQLINCNFSMPLYVSMIFKNNNIRNLITPCPCQLAHSPSHFVWHFCFCFCFIRKTICSQCNITVTHSKIHGSL